MNQVMPDKWKPVIIGGVVMGVLSGLPLISALNCACCMLILGGGVLSSYLYSKDFPPQLQPPTIGDGALLGLMAGIVGAVVSTVVSIPVSLLGIGAAQMQSMLDLLRDNPDLPPEVLGLLEGILAGGALGIGMIIGLIFSLVLYSIFGTLGGILGMAIFVKGSSAPPAAPAGGPPQVAPAGGYEPPPPAPPKLGDSGDSGSA